MTEMARKRDSNMKANNVDYGWTLQGAFSVDLDPTRVANTFMLTIL